MAPQNLSTEQWEVTVDLVKIWIQLYFIIFEDMIKNPDPRVKWALDIMDQEGEVREQWTLILTPWWLYVLYSFGDWNYVHI